MIFAVLVGFVILVAMVYVGILVIVIKNWPACVVAQHNVSSWVESVGIITVWCRSHTFLTSSQCVSVAFDLVCFKIAT